MIKGKRGGILIYMLGVITLLSIIVTEFLVDAAVSMRYRSQMAGRQDLEIIAYSALETSLAVLAEIKLIEEGLYAPIQGWGDPLKYSKLSIPSGYTVNVTIKDETGMLSLYDKNLDDFGNLLTEIGISYEQVVSLKNELKKYLEKFKEKDSLNAPRQQNQQGQNQQQTNQQQNNSQANRTQTNQRNGEEKKAVQTLFNLNQLKEMPIFEKTFFDSKGNPNAKFQILKDNISVFNTGKVNINTAPALVKKMFLGTLGLGPAADGKKFFKSMADIGRESNDKRFGFKANVFDIEIEVMRGPVKYHLSAMVEDKSANGSRTSTPPTTPETPPAPGTSGTSPAPGAPGTSTPPSTPGTQTAPGTSRAPTQPGASRSSENKSNFVFLSLTEDDSSVN